MLISSPVVLRFIGAALETADGVQPRNAIRPDTKSGLGALGLGPAN